MTTAAEFIARRLASDGMSMVSRWQDPAGGNLCFCLEPGLGREAHPGIPSGLYSLKLRTWGEKHQAYRKRFGASFHKGMVEICGVASRADILLHIGNSIADTEGCSLAGETLVRPELSLSRHWEVAKSEAAYRRVYPILRDQILRGPTQLRILPIGDAA